MYIGYGFVLKEGFQCFGFNILRNVPHIIIVRIESAPVNVRSLHQLCHCDLVNIFLFVKQLCKSISYEVSCFYR